MLGVYPMTSQVPAAVQAATPAPEATPAPAPAAAATHGPLTVKAISANAPQGSNTPTEVPTTVVALTDTPADGAAAADAAAAAAAAQPSKFTLAGLEFESEEAAAQTIRSLQGRQRNLEERERALRAQQDNPEADRWFKAAEVSIREAAAKGVPLAELSQKAGFDVTKAFPDLAAAQAPPWDPQNPWVLTDAENRAIDQAMIEDPSGRKAMQLQSRAMEARMRHLADSTAPILREREARRQETVAERQANDYYRANVGPAMQYLLGLVEDGKPVYPTLASGEAMGQMFFNWFASQGYDPRDPVDLETAAAAFENPALRRRLKLEAASAPAPTPAPVVPPRTARVASPVADLTLGGQDGVVDAGTTPAAVPPSVRIFGNGRTRTEAERVLGHPVSKLLQRTGS